MSALTVWKYATPITLTTSFGVDMPAGARLLHVAGQYADVCVWALVDPTAPLQPRRFRVVGTGHPLPDLAESGDAYHYVGTALLAAGDLVLHLFEVAPATARGEPRRLASDVSFGVDWPS